MKRIQNIGIAAVLVAVLLFASCSNEFLDRKPSTALESELVLTDPDMLPSTVVGSMSMFSGYGFIGRNATVGGDLMTDVAVTMGKAGWLQDLEKWNIFTNTSEVEAYWDYCYAITAACVQTVYYANKLMNEGGLTNAQVKNLKNAIAVSDVMRAYCDFFVAQNFCVDINLPEAEMPGTRKDTKVGIILLKDKPLAVDENANMSTLEATYKHIEETLEEAFKYFDETGTTGYTAAGEARYFPTLCAAYVMKARVALAQHKYDVADQAADDALANLPSGTSASLYSSFDALADSYTTAQATSEDIWTVNYTSSDNLSSNSLRNFYGTYNCKISEQIRDKFKAADFRKNLYPSERDEERGCCWKYPNDNGVFNVPVMRVPELYLIKAECAAANGNNAKMIENIFVVLKARDTSVHTIADVEGGNYNYGSVSDINKMIEIVLDERVKELCGEGFRWGDLRRNANYGIRLNRPGESSDPKYLLHFGNYNVARFALPIPISETSTKQWANGRGLYDDGTKDKENWQNNAWDKKLADGTYTVSEEDLQPHEGDGLNLE